MRALTVTLLLFILFVPFLLQAQVTDDAATTDEDTPITFSVTANDLDDDEIDPATVDLDISSAGRQTSLSVANGTFSANDTGDVTFTPAAGVFGTAVAGYSVLDKLGNEAGSASITVTIVDVNDPPVTADDAASTSENTEVSINILSNDADSDGTLNAATIDLDVSTPGVQNSNTTTAGLYVVSGGVLTFTPASNFSGITSIQYTVQDDDVGTSNSSTVTITVTNVNAAPVAADDAVSGSEDNIVSINVLANDTDDSGLDASTVDLNTSLAGVQNTRTVAEGMFSVVSGVVEFDPLSDWNGTVTLDYTVNDSEGLTSNVATIEITLNPVNDAPIVANDVATTEEDNPISVNVLSNDSDPDGSLNPTSVDINTTLPGIQSTLTTGNGSYTVNASGVVTFTPASNYSGTTALQYTVQDNLGLTSSTATLSITVNSENDSPVANDDAASTNEGQAVAINVLANDTDDAGLNPASVDLDPSTGGIQSTVTVAQGNFSVNGSGVVTFSPTANFSGVVTRDYTVNDNAAATSNVATITITVVSVNSAPVAVNDAVSTNEDVAVTIDVTLNDTDDDGLNKGSVDLNTGVAGIQNTRTTAQGNFAANASGVVTFTPALNFFGTAALTYTINDNEGASSNQATITITVNSVNDEPVAVNDTRTTNEDTPATLNVVANDTDVDGSVVASTVDLNVAVNGIQSSVTTSEGTYTANAAGVVTFVPVINFFGSSSIQYAVSDNVGATSDAATITITVVSVNDAPIAANDIANTNQGQTVTVSVVANDIDVDGTINAASVDLNTATGGVQNTITVAGGTYSVNAAGVVTFVPVSNFSGTSSITYIVSDNAGALSNAATLSVLVNFVNQSPTAQNDAVTTNEDVPLNIAILTNDSDPDGTLNPSTVDLNPSAAGVQNSFTITAGTFSVAASGVVAYTPALHFNGTATFNYTVNDNIGATSNSATVTVTVSPVNDLPVAANDAATTTEDQLVSINVLANDSDIDGTINPGTVDLDPSTDAIDGNRTLAQGTFSANSATGVVTFTPATNFNGSVSISYNARDNTGAKSNNASIMVTVSNVSDPPAFDDLSDQRVLKNGAARTISITGITPGPGENEQVLITATSGNSSLIPHPTISYAGTGATATLTFKPQLNQSGVADITVKAVDAGLNEFTRTFQITVANVSFTSTPATLAVENELYEYVIEINDLPETLNFIAIQKPAWATLTSTGKNKAKLSGIPPVNAPSGTVRLQVREGTTVIDEQQYQLVVNRRPVATPFGMQLSEDVAILLPVANFLQVYTDPNSHPLSDIQITALPRHGSLSLAGSPGTPVVKDQVIPLSSLSTLTYQPGQEYNGLDTLYYKVRDGYSFSSAATYVHFVVNPVNDAPIITALESEQMEFDIGRELAQIFTSTFDAVDPDGDRILSAEIGFRRPNFNPEHDLLSFTNTGDISGTYDVQAGILTLSGEADVEDYVSAIRSITYNYVNLDDIILDPRTIYISLNDGKSASDPKERVIKLVYDFVELNIPEVFTPDGNNANDSWTIGSEIGLDQYNDATIRVFDKRGRMVFEAVGFDTPWDGTNNGKPVPADTYFYIIDLNYGRIEYTGAVTILRQTR